LDELLTEAICILYPILPIRRIHCGSIAYDIVETHILAVHNVQAPQRWIFYVEVLHVDIRHIPKHKWHWSPWLRSPFLRIVPHISVSINSACSIAINGDLVSRNDETSVMVLEGYWVGIVAPVTQVIRELQIISFLSSDDH
jgi:hypothetical protein